MNVKNAFFNGDLPKEVYVHLPPSYTYPPNKICRHCRALYGFKQTPHVWFSKFNDTIEHLGFHSCLCDFALFIWKAN